MPRLVPFSRRPLALAAGALALGLSLSACDADPSGAGASDAPPGVLAGVVVDPAAVGSGGAGDPSGGVSFAAGLPTEATNQNLARVAKAVARVLADEDARSYVHQRAAIRFDGETNVLWRSLEAAADAPGGFGSTRGLAFSSLLVDRADGALGPDLATPAAVNATVTAAAQALGGPMHLLWIDADDVGPAEAPLVTFTPLGMDPDAIEQILAYDADGVEHVVNDDVAARRPIVALSYNERVTDEEAVQVAASGSDLETANRSSMGGPQEECDGLNCGGSAGSGYHRAGSPDPVIPRLARLDYIKLPHIYEGFTMGGPEIRLQVTSYNAATDTTNARLVSDIWESHHIDKSWEDGKPILIGKNIMPWNVDDNPTLSMKWTEVDDFSALADVTDELVENAQFDLPDWADKALAVVNYVIDMAGKDEDLNHADVNYESDIDMYYGLGKIDFQVSRAD